MDVLTGPREPVFAGCSWIAIASNWLTDDHSGLAVEVGLGFQDQFAY